MMKDLGKAKVARGYRKASKAIKSVGGPKTAKAMLEGKLKKPKGK